MKRFLVSFDDGSMAHIPEAELPVVDAATDGSITAGPYPETKPVIGGFSIIEVNDRDEALAWAAKLAASCRCPQEVREIMFDPES